MSDLFNVEEFLKETQGAITPENEYEDSERVLKLHFGSENNHGKIFFVPLLPTKGNITPWTYLTRGESSDDRTKELKLYHEDFETEVWHKLFPKKYYPEMTPEQEALYSRACSKFDYLWDGDYLSFNQQKRGSYGLIYGKVLAHYNKQNEEIKDHAGKVALMIFPSSAMSRKVKEAIDSTSLQNRGDTSWIPKIYNNQKEGRIGYVQVNFTKGSTGYDVTITHGINGPMNQVIPEDFIITNEDESLLGDIIDDLFGFHLNENGGRFNEKIIRKMLSRMDEIIKDDESTSESPTPLVNQNKDIDPMLGGNVPPAPPSI